MMAGPEERPWDLRHWMRQFATGVTIILAPNQGQWHGMTANAFTSVSIRPPQVLLCLSKTGTTVGLVESSGEFVVCVLADHQEALAHRYASNDVANQRISPRDLLWSKSGQPYLQGSLAWMGCLVRTVHDGGDHNIVVAQVIEGEVGDNASAPVIFYGGRFSSLS